MASSWSVFNQIHNGNADIQNYGTIKVTGDTMKVKFEVILNTDNGEYEIRFQNLSSPGEDVEYAEVKYMLTEIFEKCSKKVNPILAARWIRRELVRVLNYNKIDMSDMRINEEQFIRLIQAIDKNKITEKEEELRKLIYDRIIYGKRYFKSKNKKKVER